VSSSLVSGATLNATAAPGGLDDICALSPLQQDIFSDPDHAQYVEQALWSNDAPLDGEVLKRSWNLLAQRHPILRTLFRQARKQPVQVVRAASRVSLSLHNINHEPETQQQATLQQTIRQELMLPFDLGKGPLFRVNAFRLSDNSFKTLLTFHPILMDRQSVEMIHLEVSAIYEAALKENLPSEQETATVKDFILWLKRQDAAEAARYWEQCLDGASVGFTGRNKEKIDSDTLFVGSDTDRNGNYNPTGYAPDLGLPRCHILGRQNGGSGTEMRNLFACSQRGVNTGRNSMRTYEDVMRSWLDVGDKVYCSGWLTYASNDPLSATIHMYAKNNKGQFFEKDFQAVTP